MVRYVGSVIALKAEGSTKAAANMFNHSGGYIDYVWFEEPHLCSATLILVYINAELFVLPLFSLGDHSSSLDWWDFPHSSPSIIRSKSQWKEGGFLEQMRLHRGTCKHALLYLCSNVLLPRVFFADRTVSSVHNFRQILQSQARTAYRVICDLTTKSGSLASHLGALSKGRHV